MKMEDVMLMVMQCGYAMTSRSSVLEDWDE